jgi:hypothetical protein
LIPLWELSTGLALPVPTVAQDYLEVRWLQVCAVGAELLITDPAVVLCEVWYLAIVTLFLLLVPLTHLPSFLLFPSMTKMLTRRRDNNDENDKNGAGSLGHGRVDASGPAAARSLLFAKNDHFPLIIPHFISLHVLLLQKQGGQLKLNAVDQRKGPQGSIHVLADWNT